MLKRSKGWLGHIAWIATTGMGLGYLPAAGTLGSCLGALHWLLFETVVGAKGQALVLACLVLCTPWICQSVECLYEHCDPSEFIWDEYLVTYACCSCMRPKSCGGLLLLLVLFRIYDISKLGPVGWAETYFSPKLAIMMDDLIAGFLACCSYLALPYLFTCFFGSLGV